MRPCLFARTLASIVGLLLIACGGGSPTQPSSPGSSGVSEAPKPAPLQGTRVHTFQLPDTNDPLQVWITKMTPATNSILSMGENSLVEYACGGPSGYEVTIGLTYMSGDLDARNGKPLDLSRVSGTGFRVGSKCDGTGGQGFTPNSDSVSPIDRILIAVWASKGKMDPANKPTVQVSTEPYTLTVSR